MASLLARVLPLALGAAVSPTILAVAVLLLSSPRRPLVRELAFTVGAGVVLAGFSVVAWALLRRSTESAPSAGEAAVTGAIDITIGLVLLALAASAWLRGPEAERSRPRGGGGGVGAAFVLGTVMMLTNLTSLVLYVPAVKEIAVSGESVAAKLLVVALAFLITMLPATVPLAIRVVAPGPSVALLARVNAFIARHQHAIVLGVEIVFGVYLLVRGLRDL